MKNYHLLKYIIPLNNTWFWLGIWVLYYLKFTDYGGIGLVESVWLFTALFLEVPTGSLSDILGKKPTLQIGLLLAGIGNIVMGLSQSMPHLFMSVFIMGIGSTLISGNWEALLFDSLKEEGREDTYDSYLAKIEKYSLLPMAGASLLGGYLYTMHNSLPFHATGLAMIIGAALCYFLHEPKIDTKTFSFSRYIKQTSRGFGNIFREINLNWVVRLLLLASIVIYIIEVLDPALAITYGLKPEQLGIFYAIMPVITALGLHYYDNLKRLFGFKKLYYVVFTTFVLTLIISPVVGLAIGIGTIAFRNIFYYIANVMASDKINKLTESSDRATTISSFNMLRKLPYVFTAVLFGSLIDERGALVTAAYLGVIYVALLIIWEVRVALRSKN